VQRSSASEWQVGSPEHTVRKRKARVTTTRGRVVSPQVSTSDSGSIFCEYFANLWPKLVKIT